MTALPPFRRDALYRAFNGDATLVSAFEQLIQYVTDAADQAGAGAAIADVLAGAPILSLSAVEGLGAARVLTESAGVALVDDGSRLTVSLTDLTPKVEGGHVVNFIVTGETTLVLPTMGTLATLADLSASIGGAVVSFNTRTGAVVLLSADVIGALGYTPTSVTGLTGVQSVAGFKTGLSLVKGDVGLGSVDNTADAAKAVLSATKFATARNINGVAFDGTAAITLTANLAAARAIAMSGDVVWSVSFDGSGNVTSGGTIQAGAVTLSKMANMATASLIYRKTAGSGAPEVQTLATLKTDLGLTGTNSGDQTITLTGDITGSGTGSFAATIGNNKVTFAKIVAASAASIVGATAAGNFAELTPSSARSVLGLGTSATVNIGTSGATIPLLSGANTWTTAQTFNSTANFAGNVQVTGGGLRIQGAGGGFTLSGEGLELEYSGGEAYISGYDRAGAYKNLNMRGLAVKWWANGTNFLQLEGHFGNFANDAAASVGGVPVTGMYRNGSVLMVRVT